MSYTKWVAGSGLLLQGLLPVSIALAENQENVEANLVQVDNIEIDAVETITVVGRTTNALITEKELQRYQANDLADVFRVNPSISVGGSVGIAQKVYVRGIEDSLINVTVDGAPQTSTLFHHIGRVTIDPDLLQEVDVQAGAGEATSGAGAIGGAIRFKTKDASDLLGAKDRFGGQVKVSNFSNKGQQHSASLVGKIGEDWGALAYWNNIDRENMKNGRGDEILGTSADQTLGFFKISGELSEHQYLSLSYERREEEGEFSARPNWIVLQGERLYGSESERDTAVLNYTLSKSDAVNLETTVYQTESSFRGGRFDFLAQISTFGFDIRNTSLIGDHKFTYGVDYRDDDVESGYAIPQPEEDHAEEGSVLGLYAQGYSQVSDALLLSYGLRYDDYSYQQKILLDDYYGTPITDVPVEQDSSTVSINAGLAYDFTEGLTLALGIAQAARGKEIGDGFTIDAYLYDRTDAPLVDPNLEVERVTNVEASLEYAKDNFSAKLAVFDSKIEDVIFERLYGNSLYQNIGAIKTSGVELDLNYRWNEFEVFLGFSANDTELDPDADLYSANFGSVPLGGYEFIGLGNSRGDTLNLGVNYTPTSHLSLGVNVSHVSGLTIDTLHQDVDLGFVSDIYSLDKPSYTTVDVFTQWQIRDGLVVNLAATNLFDELYRDHSSVGDYSAVEGYELVVGPWEAGRDIRLSVELSF
ncbi:TonB-dependent siderophore receptor [Arenicella sp. 4NH20-0111]|uniref:TonB-dependent receptor domain-containing protein n=1 Tax=Arenicella sp. 4NH20-0111 TaxID=3127648 RepID=UPI0031079EF2